MNRKTISQTVSTAKRILNWNITAVPALIQVPNLVVAFMLVFASISHAGTTASPARRFATPDEAVAALRLATATADQQTLREIFGPGVEDLVNPDRIQATNEVMTFSSAIAQTNHLVRVSDNLLLLEVGDDSWPFPVPLVKGDGGWFFDTNSGKDELLSRRIGKNELGVLPVMRAYVDAQREYASSDHNGDGVLEYAQRLVSSPGKEDGLYWPPAFEGDESPLGPLVAYAQAEGYNPQQHDDEIEVERGPYHGYYFKILTRQGKHAPIGKYDYVVNGHMIGGFALVAWPADYGVTGIMTFIVNQQSRVYQKDLGTKTSKVVKKMKGYDPDPGWTLSKD